MNTLLENDQETKRIRQILGINPEGDYKKEDFIYRLELKDIIIDDFSKFLPYLDNVRTIDLTNCTIASFSELLKLDNCSYFYLDNVTFLNQDCTVVRDFPAEIRFSNMSFDASCLNGLHTSFDKIIKHFAIKNCHIDNIQELSNIAGLYSLDFDTITFTYKAKKIKQKSLRRIYISNSKFEDLSFMPFSKSLSDITFSNCHIGSFAGLSEFKKLEEIIIDTDTIVENTEEQENPFNKQLMCSFVKEKKTLNLKNVRSLKNYINQFYFGDCKEKTIDDLDTFKKVDSLIFYNSRFYVDAFLPIAKQIKRIEISKSVIKKHTYFKNYPNLTSFELVNHEEEQIKSKNFSKLLPLKKQLKEMKFYESKEIPTTYPIGKFTALESLKIGYEVSVQTAESIMTLKNLKKLDISVEKTKQILNIGSLKNLEFLIFNSNIGFTGFEHLKKLRSLDTSCSRKFDINSMPKMKSLKRLNLSSYGYKIKGLSQFPNLEFLKLNGVKKLELKTLRKLKVLDLDNSEIKNFSSFEIQPSVEKLDLSSLQGKINLKEIAKFPNLKWLTLLESYELNNISGLEPLKKLERLDLHQTKVTDVRVLNTLPNLKEVNLAVYGYKYQELKSQLDQPEIGIFSGLPLRNLSIWKKDEFGI
ncbi:leucine-rich repeat domain-containing protein [Chryseobacterium sp. Mn2064]